MVPYCERAPSPDGQVDSRALEPDTQQPLRQAVFRMGERRPAVSFAGRCLPPKDTPRRSRRTPRRSAFSPAAVTSMQRLREGG